MSKYLLNQPFSRLLLGLLLSATLFVTGWVYLQPRLSVDPAAQVALPVGPALAEGHEGSFGGG